MKSIIKFLTSIPLAVTLILIIAALSIVSTLIPQDEAKSFYENKYPSPVAFIIVTTGFHHFSTSLLLITPVVFFFINLCACTIRRLFRELNKKIHRRFGPDIIHFGLLVLIIGSLVTITGKVKEFTYLGKGDSVKIMEDYTLVVDDCEYIMYDDGRAKDWISTLSIIKDGETIVSSFAVEVNKPLLFKDLKIMQTSYTDEPILIVADKDGKEYQWLPGHLIKTDNSTILFHGINTNPRDKNDKAAIFEENFDDNTMHFITGKPGDTITDYLIKQVYLRDMTGLTFVIDPGFDLVLISLILIGLGLSLTFIQKIGDKTI
ncbi:MAG: cytochrome c biogenesis protein ResB [Spirochaetales bacterium]|nr:cytochrome c biogenesis protein ResB [Spirochaetales bacterium]